MLGRYALHAMLHEPRSVHEQYSLHSAYLDVILCFEKVACATNSVLPCKFQMYATCRRSTHTWVESHLLVYHVQNGQTHWSGCRDVTNFGNSLGMSSYFNFLFPDPFDNSLVADFVVAHCETTPGVSLMLCWWLSDVLAPAPVFP
jgi:hypothetical protein